MQYDVYRYTSLGAKGLILNSSALQTFVCGTLFQTEIFHGTPVFELAIYEN